MNNLQRAAGVVLCVVSATVTQIGAGADLDGARPGRTAAFTQKPTVTRDGDTVTITFTSNGFCDATVAIEDPSTGSEQAPRIVRHLASGVLGPNAPEPFKKNSRRQELVWDSKDDQGRYVDDLGNYRVRVSLGLRARFERTLYWSPKRRATSHKYTERNSPAIAAAPEGVYVCDSGGGDFVRLFDHDGNYVRTIYPFPSAALTKIRGLRWVTFPPDGKKMAFKTDLPQTTFLTCGGGLQKMLAVRGGRLALIGSSVNWLSSEVKAGGPPLSGPRVTFPVGMSRVHSFKGGTYHFGPRSAAFSPDGKWLYLTNYRWGNPWREGILPGVARLPVKSGGALEVFLGNVKKKGGEGADDGSFGAPTSVDCDSQGRLYVSDYLNNRIQIFAPDGKHLRSVKVTRPALVQVHRKTGDIVAFTWSMASCYAPTLGYRGPAKVTRFGPFNDPRKIAAYPIKVSAEWALKRAAVDAWADPLRIWIADATVRVYEVAGEKLVLKKDFAAAARRRVIRTVGPRHGRQRLYFNPGDGHLYVGAHQDPAVIHAKGFYKMVRINPRTGKLKIIHLPFDAEDLAFDMQGLAYLRTHDFVARFDSSTWREVPFDYGEERKGASYQGFRSRDVASGLVAAAGFNSSSQFGGIGVSPKGNVAVAFYNPNRPVDRRKTMNIHSFQVKKYAPRVFPGRAVECLIHVWDKHGKTLYEDAVPGVGRSSSVAIDRDDGIYLLANGQTMHGGTLYPNASACTLLRVRPGARIIAGGKMPIPLPSTQRPKRPGDVARWFGTGAPVWGEGIDWVFGGVGLDGKHYAKCHCIATSQMGFDYFGRAFVGETHRCEVVVVDSAGNEILRVGRYGNIDEGRPLATAGGPPAPRAVGGDEVTLVNPKFVAADTDRRLFIADVGNYRILSVKLDYHATQTVPLGAGPKAGK